MSIELRQRFLVLAKKVRHVQTVLHLQVSLPVKLGGLDVDQPVGIERR